MCSRVVFGKVWMDSGVSVLTYTILVKRKVGFVLVCGIVFVRCWVVGKPCSRILMIWWVLCGTNVSSDLMFVFGTDVL